jgi:hypothetical protein
MNTPVKIGGFAVGLVAVFAAAVGIGTAVGPIGESAASSPAANSASDGASAGHGDMTAGVSSSSGTVEDVMGGLMVSERGYTLALTADQLAAGSSTPVGFRILGPDGRPVTSYDETHDEDLHFIAVRRDMTGFQHVHPQLAGDGTWTTPLELTPGDWRVFADFTPSGGQKLTLGGDLAVAGDYTPQPLPAPAPVATVDGYTVTLNGDLVAGQESDVTLSVSRDGQPVTDLEPYLAAYGHLVALRDGDLAYLHVHPAGEPGDGATRPGPDITFSATAPSAGDYRLFLDFQHEGVVRTAEFTARATAEPTAAKPTDTQPPAAPTTEAGEVAGHGHG